MKIITIIPARMGSSRFPGKPLALINGKPMIEHVYTNVSKCSEVESTYVATCDIEIFNHIKSIGGNAVMTSNLHERASDRCAEALESIEESHECKYDIVIMVQGDEPMVAPEMISESIAPFYDDPNIKVANLIAEIGTNEEFEDRNCIKVVLDKNQNALYFSRQPIPTHPLKMNKLAFKQVCIIPFNRDFLIQYTKMEPTPLEIYESVDMMRVLESGYKVKMIPTKFQTHAVDTPEDLAKVAKLMNDKN